MHARQLSGREKRRELSTRFSLNGNLCHSLQAQRNFVVSSFPGLQLGLSILVTKVTPDPFHLGGAYASL